MRNLYLAHHGILGQQWGTRRYQNPDGTLTEEGKEHYSKGKSYVSTTKTAANVARDNFIAVRNQNVQDYKATAKSTVSPEQKALAKKRMQENIVSARKEAQLEQKKINTVNSMRRRLDLIDTTDKTYQSTKKMIDEIVDQTSVRLDEIDREIRNSKERRSTNQISTKLHR